MCSDIAICCILYSSKDECNLLEAYTLRSSCPYSTDRFSNFSDEDTRKNFSQMAPKTKNEKEAISLKGKARFLKTRYRYLHVLLKFEVFKSQQFLIIFAHRSITVIDSSHGNPYIVKGSLYEINHKKLTRKCPKRLKSVRIVKVTETTDDSVSIRFPSGSSFRKLFKILSGTNTTRKKMWKGKGPRLDSVFTMKRSRAKEILKCQVTREESRRNINLENFWFFKSVIIKEELAEKEITVDHEGLSRLKEELAEKETTVEHEGLPLIESARSQGWGTHRKAKVKRQCNNSRERPRLLPAPAPAPALAMDTPTPLTTVTLRAIMDQIEALRETMMSSLGSLHAKFNRLEDLVTHPCN